MARKTPVFQYEVYDFRLENLGNRAEGTGQDGVPIKGIGAIHSRT
jgi:hypothetical protein